MTEQALAVGGAEAQFKLGDTVLADPPALQVGPGVAAHGRCQVLLEIAPGGLVQPEQFLLLRLVLAGGQGYAGLLGQPLQRLAKLQVFHLHDEGENVAAGGAGTEAVPRLPFLVDVEGRGAFLVEGAAGLEGTPRPLQCNVPRHHVHNVQTGLYVVNNCHRLAP